MLKKFFPVLLLFLCKAAYAQQLPLYNPSIDVQHYEFHIQVSDNNDSLTGKAVITARFTKKSTNVSFDLISLNDTGRGMMVTSVLEKNKQLVFSHQNNMVNIQLTKPAEAGENRTFTIQYKGIPADGLIISKNKFGNRTFFSDNWPNRARNWIPCKDHLSDKASVEFVVTAPDHYKVVSNGIRIKEMVLPSQLRRTHWLETVALPTKVMAVGIADFAVEQAGTVNNIPVTSWVFPENKKEGFTDYAQATEILPFFIKQVGPYAYLKLANVQSKTIFGGMENAAAIFYTETSITGKHKMEELLTHEIAHQWFGNHATETDWPHLWLSEGFATAMTHLYMEQKFGRDTLISRLQNDRRTILAFTKIKRTAVVDSAARTRPMTMLNAHSYQKGGWILLMLRNQLGNETFWKAIQRYYNTYKGRNASTADLQKVFEEVSGKDLTQFFTQWLYTPENPTISISWNYDEADKKIDLIITQQTATTFVLPLEVAITDAAGKKTITKIDLRKKNISVTIPYGTQPVNITADPNCRLLMEAVIKKMKS